MHSHTKCSNHQFHFTVLLWYKVLVWCPFCGTENHLSYRAMMNSWPRCWKISGNSHQTSPEILPVPNNSHLLSTFLLPLCLEHQNNSRETLGKSVFTRMTTLLASGNPDPYYIVINLHFANYLEGWKAWPIPRYGPISVSPMSCNSFSA